MISTTTIKLHRTADKLSFVLKIIGMYLQQASNILAEIVEEKREKMASQRGLLYQGSRTRKEKTLNLQSVSQNYESQPSRFIRVV